MDSLLSGPAGGVVGRRGDRPAVAAGTGSSPSTWAAPAPTSPGSTATSSTSSPTGWVRWSWRLPALAIETVAAGGGSICRVEQGRLAVGPQSAGASPGPATYGAGGPLTLTDVNLLLGRLVAERFPDPHRSRGGADRFDELRSELETPAADRAATRRFSRACCGSPTRRMAEAIRHISVRKGIDPAGYSLVAFGGAGGQHACRSAELLGMEEVFSPADAGSAERARLSVTRWSSASPSGRCFDLSTTCPRPSRRLARGACRPRPRDGAREGGYRLTTSTRRAGSSSCATWVRTPTSRSSPRPDADLGRLFEEAYYKLFSYRPSERGDRSRVASGCRAQPPPRGRSRRRRG